MMPPTADEAPSETPRPTYTNGGARWHIEAPDFVFQSPTPEAAEELAVSPSGFGQAGALFPESQMPAPDEDPAGLFDASFPDADAVDVPLPPHQIANGKTAVAAIVPAHSDTIQPAASDSFAALRGLSEDELNALFG